MIESRLRYYGPLCIVLALSLFYLLPKLNHGWIPHDEGLLAQSAERVLLGELPHRDFDEPYTGGLSILHALSFRLLGDDLRSLRITLLLFLMGSLPVLYGIAARITSVHMAAMITLGSVVWTIPNYFASLPSWYNLFFAIHGTWAIMKFIETDRLRWLLVAGVLGGCSMLIKIVGIYFIAATFLFLIFHEQERRKELDEPKANRRRFLSLFHGVACAILLGAVVLLIRRRGSGMDFLLFVLPTITLVAVILWNERNTRWRDDWKGWKRLILNYLIVTGGVALPIGFFLIPYIATSGIEELYVGNFVLPQKRMEFAAYALPSLSSLLTLFPIFLAMIPIGSRYPWLRSPGMMCLFILLSVIAVLLGGTEDGYRKFWNSLRPMIPLVTLFGAWSLWNGQRDVLRRWNRERLFGILSVASMLSLVQFPFSAPIYFCYIAPFAILASVFVAQSVRGVFKEFQVLLLVIYIAFGMLWGNGTYIQSLGVAPVFVEQSTPLGIERADLRVPSFDANVYRPMIECVQQHSATEEWIYASADCPEVYFLSSRKNPTRTFYDFFDADFQSDRKGRSQRLLAMLGEKEIRLVVLKWKGEFSGSQDPEFVQEIENRYPHSQSFTFFPEGNEPPQPDFTVFWRD